MFVELIDPEKRIEVRNISEAKQVIRKEFPGVKRLFIRDDQLDGWSVRETKSQQSEPLAYIRK